ncbi:MAG: GTPase ObgE, partial [Verrucomicrobiota bacterium]
MRCRILLFVVDIAGSEGRNPVEDVSTLREEISLYSSELAKRSWCIVANKIDLPQADENVAAMKERFSRVKIFPISANEGMGLDKLKAYLSDKIGKNVE